VEIPAGGVREVPLPDGSLVRIRKLEEGFDTADAPGAWRRLGEARARGEFLTGLFHLAPGRPTFVESLDLVEEPLALLPQERLRPPRSALADALDGLTP
jgi:2-oxoglutarate ferredoxin oxidoreductase subunit beta